ncbi:hypothetical protein [Streptomyces sp. NPDC054804]
MQLHLHRPDHADRFVVLSQQVSALNREIAIRRMTEAHREQPLLAEQAAASCPPWNQVRICGSARRLLGKTAVLVSADPNLRPA